MEPMKHVFSVVTKCYFHLTSTGVLHHQVERPLCLNHFKKFD